MQPVKAVQVCSLLCAAACLTPCLACLAAQCWAEPAACVLTALTPMSMVELDLILWPLHAPCGSSCTAWPEHALRPANRRVTRVPGQSSRLQAATAAAIHPIRFGPWRSVLTWRCSMTSVCRPLAVQALRKPVCSFGQVPSRDTPLFGGWGDIQICSQHLSAGSEAWRCWASLDHWNS